MKVFVLGASGYVGGQIIRQLGDHNVTIRALVRKYPKTPINNVTYIEGQFTALIEADGTPCIDCPWLEHLTGCDILINAIGIIRETTEGTFRHIHQDGPKAVFKAAYDRGVGKIIQISALGADESAQTSYHESKREADNYLKTLGIDFTIFRPSLIFGRNDQSMRLFTTMALLPITPVPGSGNYRLQPIYIDDLCLYVWESVNESKFSKQIIDLGGATILTLNQLYDELALWCGKTKTIKFHVPLLFMKLTAKLTDLLGGMGPISSGELTMLINENYCQHQPEGTLFERPPRTFREGLDACADKNCYIFQQRLSASEPLLRIAIALLWWITVAACCTSSGQAYTFAYLEKLGIRGQFAPMVLYSTLVFEFALGALTLVKWQLVRLCTFQITVIIFFTAILTYLDGLHLWAHPFGVLAKNIPLVASLVILRGMHTK